MDDVIFKLLLALSVVVLFLIARIRRKKYSGPDGLEQTLPAVFDGARCVMNEQNIHTQYPVVLHGRIDQLFKIPDGRHIILDTKHRGYNRVFHSDQVQLSVYATILASQGYRIHPIAYLRFTGSDKPVYVPVELLHPDQIVQKVQRYWQIKQGQHHPVCTCGKH